jgi:hypothetical protein
MTAIAVGYDSERGPHQDHSTKVWFQLAKLLSEEKILNDFFFVEFSIFSNGGKPNIYTCCSSSNICRCCSLCGFYRVEYCLATSGLVVWLVGSFQSTLSEIAKQNVLGDSMCISINKGRNPSNAKLSDFSKVWFQLAKLLSEEKILNDFFFVEFSIFSNGDHLGWERDHRIQF